jgi:hypothetical protein
MGQLQLRQGVPNNPSYGIRLPEGSAQPRYRAASARLRVERHPGASEVSWRLRQPVQLEPQCNHYQETLLIYSSQESVHRRATPLQDKLRTISASVRDVTATDG